MIDQEFYMALPTTAKLIRNEIVNTAKFSFVIAYEFKVNQTVVAREAKSVLGSRLFEEREKIALRKLYEDYQELLNQGVGKEESFSILHINRNCGWKILNKYKSQEQEIDSPSEVANCAEITPDATNIPVSVEADNTTTKAGNDETVEAEAFEHSNNNEDLDIIVIDEAEDTSRKLSTTNQPRRSLGALNYLLSNQHTPLANTKGTPMTKEHLSCNPIEDGDDSGGGGNEFLPIANNLIHLNYQGVAISYHSNLSPEKSIVTILRELNGGLKL